MADPADAKTIFFVKSSNTKIFDNTHNRKYLDQLSIQYDDIAESEYSQSEGGGNEEPVQIDYTPSIHTVLRITTKDEHDPRDPTHGFTIGSNPDDCDILLTPPDGKDNKQISGHHLSVYINQSNGEVCLRNHAIGGTRIYFAQQDRRTILSKTRFLLPGESAEVDFGSNLNISIQRSQKDPDGWEEYRGRLNSMQQPGVVGLGRLALSTTAPSTVVASSTIHVSKYHKREKLGRGGTGEVYKASRKSTGDVYALKEFKEKMRDEEKTILMRLKHKHIVEFKEFESAVDSISHQHCTERLIMELIDGPDLEHVISRPEPLSSEKIKIVMYQLLDAVAYMHRSKVSHRDIKPANVVMVSEEPINVKLVDFGFASENSIFQTSCGTRLFYPPELLKARTDRQCTNKVDIFSAGVLLMRLQGERFGLEHDKYYSTKACYSAVESRLAALATSKETYPPHLNLALCMLVENPDDRLTAEECLAHHYFDDIRASMEEQRANENGHGDAQRESSCFRCYHPYQT
ncbi:hypothetical protein SEUCBS139899_010410 [Sporothrix eucalyptigena]